MLRFLKISNLAVIDSLEVEFEPGLNLLTGETGSGKSIIVDSVGQLFGDRAGPELLRTGAEKAYVEGVFRVEEREPLVGLCQTAGIELEGEEIILRRELHSSGRTRTFVNDRLVTISFVRELRPFLIDIHGQGEAQTLTSPTAQLRVLDAFANTEELRREVERLSEQYWKMRGELDRLSRSEAERLRMLDIYGFQIGEIEKVKPLPGEEEQLRRERTILTNAEKIFMLAREAYESLYEGDGSILSQESKVRRRLQQLTEYDAKVAPLQEEAERARALLEDIAYSLRDYADGIQFSPTRLQQVEERLAELERVKRKYGPTLEDVLSALEEMKKRQQELSQSSVLREELERKIQELEGEYDKLARELSEARRRAAELFEKAIVTELRALAMEKARFSVEFSPVDVVPCGGGLERVEFMVTVNVGEALRPVAKVASGGELSRLMLAIKTVASKWLGPRTLIFDEVDEGIGGRAAEAVGQRLKRLGRSHQVFCVTHQPQIARFADAHYRVTKHVVGGRTMVRVEKLAERERLEELARMLGGAEVTEITRRHARELLRTA